MILPSPKSDTSKVEENCNAVNAALMANRIMMRTAGMDRIKCPGVGDINVITFSGPLLKARRVEKAAASCNLTVPSPGGARQLSWYKE